MSTLKADTIQSTGGGAATLTKQQAAKHFVNYDAPNQTSDSSFNQSSVTDYAEGEFKSNFSSSFSSASNKVISGVQFFTTKGSNGSTDGAQVDLSASYVVSMGDLA
jgi:hypothetical protein